MSKERSIVLSDNFEDFVEKVEEFEEYYQERGDFEDEPESLKEALRRAPIPFLIDSSTQSVEQWFAKYRSWINSVRRKALKEE